MQGLLAPHRICMLVRYTINLYLSWWRQSNFNSDSVDSILSNSSLIFQSNLSNNTLVVGLYRNMYDTRRSIVQRTPYLEHIRASSRHGPNVNRANAIVLHTPEIRSIQKLRHVFYVPTSYVIQHQLGFFFQRVTPSDVPCRR